MMQINGRTQEESILAVNDALDGELRRLKEVGIDKEDLEDIKEHILRDSSIRTHKEHSDSKATSRVSSRHGSRRTSRVGSRSTSRKNSIKQNEAEKPNIIKNVINQQKYG